VILFDGVCNLCNGLVVFLVARDPRARFRFAALQSDAAALLLRSVGLAREDVLDSFILVEGGRVWQRSAACLQVARRMRFPWWLFYALVVIPRPLRNALYDYVARHRFGWFGRRETCMTPTPDLERRFLA
jgi:predicted DCC family thiol-disulfide oxidoreductase YuxK